MLAYVVGGHEDSLRQLKLKRKRPREELQLEQFETLTEQARHSAEQGRHSGNPELD